MHGDGVYHWACGDEYVGEFYEDKASGVGTYTWVSGHEYIGDYLDDQRHGQGRLRYPGGEVYEGDFMIGRQHGLGTLIFSTGHRLKGLWREDYCHGDATLQSENGSVFVCQFARNVLLPGGTVHLADGTHLGMLDYTSLCISAFRVDEPFDADWPERLFACKLGSCLLRYR